MSVTRVRVEADGRDHQEVMDDLNHAFGLIFESRRLPRDTEFVEEVVETHIREDGAIEYQGRRVIRFYEAGPDAGELAELPGPEPIRPTSWVVSGNATTVTSPLTHTIYTTAGTAASSLGISPAGTWNVMDAGGRTMDPTLTIGQASGGNYTQPFYFHANAGMGN